VQGKANIFRGTMIEMIAKTLVILLHELKLLRILKGKKSTPDP